MKYIVFDLEATCWEERKGRSNEIIEIGALQINEDLQVLGEFVQFVKPVKNPVLSDFCTQLTSIRQEDVANAPGFAEAVERFTSWIGWPNEPYELCSWGQYDQNQLRSDCRLHGLNTDWTKHHTNLKKQYQHIKGLERGIGMKNALLQEGFLLEGTHHRGIDDARNIAKIFTRYFGDWDFSEA